MLAIKRTGWLVLLLTLAACVTVNIYFPAAAAEKAADQIIDDVWQEDPQSSTQTPTTQASDPDGEEMVLSYRLSPREVLLSLFSLGSRPAYAQAVNFSASSPEVARIKASMGKRFAIMKPYYNAGAIGLTADGFVAVRDANQVAMNQRAQISALVNAENADRKALYKAIAKANNQPDWASQIQSTFAKQWISRAPSGWWYQSGGQWKRK